MFRNLEIVLERVNWLSTTIATRSKLVPMICTTRCLVASEPKTAREKVNVEFFDGEILSIALWFSIGTSRCDFDNKTPTGAKILDRKIVNTLR